MVTLDVLKANETISGQELFNQLIVAAILGIAIGVCTLIYQVEHFSYSVQIIIHFVLVTIFVFIAGYFGCWFEVNNYKSFFNVFISELIIYIFIWLFFYTNTKQNVREMNELIQKRQEM